MGRRTDRRGGGCRRVVKYNIIHVISIARLISYSVKNKNGGNEVSLCFVWGVCLVESGLSKEM